MQLASFCMDLDPRDSFPRLIELAKSGDPESIEALFEQHYQRVEELVHAGLARDVRRGRPWLATRFSTRDVVQDVFKSVLGNLSSFQGQSRDSFIGFMAMVVRNRLVDAIRHHEAERRDGRRSETPLAWDEIGGAEPGPDERVADQDEVERIQELMAQFTEREQLLVRARIDGTGSFRELAEQLGYPSREAARRAYFDVRARIAISLGDETLREDRR